MRNRAKLIGALVAAYDSGAISLRRVCPSCFEDMGFASHGFCQHCRKQCGCSFNAVSSSDHCSMHAPADHYARVIPPIGSAK